MKIIIEHRHVIILSRQLSAQVDKLLAWIEPVDTSALEEATEKSGVATNELEKTVADSQT